MYKKTFDHWYESVTDVERAELECIKDNDNEIKERFSLNLAFGTAGIVRNRSQVKLGVVATLLVIHKWLATDG